MIFGWLRRRRRRRLRDRPFPDAWEQVLRDNVWFDRRLSEPERARLRDWMKIFIPEKNWEGCGGQEMNDEVKVTIAAQAGLLVLGLDDHYFDHVLSILVYPNEYRAPDDPNRHGVVTEGGTPRMGEAWWQGPVILSWPFVLSGGREPEDGENLVLHEFAHQLDMLSGRAVDGAPPMPADELRRWAEVMTPAYERLVRHCRRGRGHRVLNCYGAKNPAEFFAVATEAFFTIPVDFRIALPDVYEVMSRYYRQDPAEWGD